MTAKKASSSTTLLVVVLLLITFPIWIGIAGALFGIAMGLFGAIIGIFGAIAGVFGGILAAIFGVIGNVFGWLFGGLFSWYYYPGIHLPDPVTLMLVVLVIALIIQSRKSPIKK